MKPERTESRWAKIQRWADLHESERAERERLAEEYEAKASQQREAERVAEEKTQKENASRPLITVLIGVFFLCAAISPPYRLIQRADMVCTLPPVLLLPPALLHTAQLTGIVVCGAEVLRVRRKFGSLDWKTYFLWPLMVFILCSLAVSSLGIAVNSLLDTNPAQIHAAQIERRLVSHSGKGGPRYYLRLRDWQNPQSTIQIQTTSDSYYQAATRKVTLVETKPGALGIEWVVSHSVR